MSEGKIPVGEYPKRHENLGANQKVGTDQLIETKDESNGKQLTSAMFSSLELAVSRAWKASLNSLQGQSTNPSVRKQQRQQQQQQQQQQQNRNYVNLSPMEQWEFLAILTPSLGPRS